MTCQKQPFVVISDQAYAILTEIRLGLKNVSEKQIASMSIITVGKLFTKISRGGFVMIYTRKPPTRNLLINFLRKIHVISSYKKSKLKVDYEQKK